MYTVTFSIVLFKNEIRDVKSIVEKCLNTKLSCKLYLVDHSPTDFLKQVCDFYNVEYIFNPENPGYGSGHNLAIKEISSKYHVVLNPDITFDEPVIDVLTAFMEKNKDIGVVMPKILYPDGSIQHLAKLLPTPLNFIIRRFILWPKIQTKNNEKFELRKSGYNKIFSAPFLSGCFLVFRTDVLKKIDGFDEKYFLYFEDIDICRRVIEAGYKTVFYPYTNVVHDHVIKSLTKSNNLKVYLRSTLLYFNKWGWFFDQKRTNLNRLTEQQFVCSNPKF